MNGEWTAIIPVIVAQGESPEAAAEAAASLSPEGTRTPNFYVVPTKHLSVFEVGVYQVPR